MPPPVNNPLLGLALSTGATFQTELAARDALEGRPEREDVTIVSDAPEGEGATTLDVRLDPDHPERSVAVVHRPEPPPDQT